MKKKIVILLSLIMIFSFTMLSACSGGGGSEDLSDSKYVGTWKAESMSLGEESEEFDREYTLVVNGDGTGTFSDTEEDAAFTWTPTDDGFETKGDVKLKFKEEDDGLVAKVIGVSLHFVRVD